MDQLLTVIQVGFLSFPDIFVSKKPLAEKMEEEAITMGWRKLQALVIFSMKWTGSETFIVAQKESLSKPMRPDLPAPRLLSSPTVTFATAIHHRFKCPF